MNNSSNFTTVIICQHFDCLSNQYIPPTVLQRCHLDYSSVAETFEIVLVKIETTTIIRLAITRLVVRPFHHIVLGHLQYVKN